MKNSKKILLIFSVIFNFINFSYGADVANMLARIAIEKHRPLDNLVNSSNVNSKDELGRSLLYYAAGFNNIDAIKELLDKGADINAKNDNLIGQTALHKAASLDNVEAVIELIKNGADKEAKDGFGWTPIVSAVRENRFRALYALLDSKANININIKDRDKPSDINLLSITLDKVLHPYNAYSKDESIRIINILLDYNISPKLIGKFVRKDIKRFKMIIDIIYQREINNLLSNSLIRQ